MTYDVQVCHYATYTVEADSPEEAAMYVDQGDGGSPEWTYAKIEAVVVHGSDDDMTDLRADVPCPKCGKLQPAARSFDCLGCILGPIRSTRSEVRA